MDGFSGKTPRPKLDYPFEAPPLPRHAVDVAPGVKWIRMPLPFALEWINLWLIEDGDGWALVDTGIATEETREHWRALFDGVMGGKPITRVLITHMHPDHVGLAGWLTRKFDAPLWMSRLEYITCRMLVADTGREAPEAGVDFYRAAGWSEDQIATYKARFGGFGKAVSRLPDAYRRLSDGQELTIGGEVWRVVMCCGHSPEHACLFRPSDGIVISGDQILPRISSNVSVFPTEPEADPLADWIASCRKLIDALPETVLTLPAHNEPFYGAHKRLDALITGHERGLSRLLSRLSEPKRAIDCFGALFARKIGDGDLSMATGETLAHLNCLIRRGAVARARDGDGVDWYRAT